MGLDARNLEFGRKPFCGPPVPLVSGDEKLAHPPSSEPWRWRRRPTRHGAGRLSLR
jgi:hypothetical protein